ncbi:MAG: nucleotidyltransferase family protein [Dysgonamonadaceae bacterium]|nr:nucleotidyltransferase family protein [Dysgonamonadaceae bacterium]
MSTNEIIGKLQEIKPHLQKEYAVKTVGLFGSYADGTYTDNSDVDILVEFERPVGWKFFTLEKFLEKTLNRKIDLVTPHALKEQIKPYILSQILYIP